MHSICLSQKTVNSFVSIPNILFNSFINFTINCSSLSEIMLFSSPCNFHMLFLNNLANPSVIATKCVIFENLSHTTSIISFSATNSNLVMKSTIKYVHSFSGTLFVISFPTSASVLFFIL